MSPSVPRHLYKYRAMTSSDGWNPFTKSAIAGRELYLSSIAQFNEPFEFCWRPGIVRRDVTPDQLRELMRQGDAFSDEQQKAFAETTPATFERALPVVVEWHRQQLEREAGVLAMAAHVDNLLMWSHYADNHKGICLKFDTSIAPFDSDVHPVIYRSDMPAFDIPGTVFEDFADQVLLGKSPCWEYEQEWRLVRLKIPAGERAVRYPPEALTGIVLGCRFPEARRPELDDWIKASGARPEICYAVQSGEKYELEVTSARPSPYAARLKLILGGSP